MSSVEPFLARTHIAYFTMEMAVRPEMHTYAGGSACSPAIRRVPVPNWSFPSSS